MRKIDGLYLKAKIRMRQVAHDVLYKENGDTNFVSVIIILGIVLLLAMVFQGQIKNVLTKTKSAEASFSVGVE